MSSSVRAQMIGVDEFRKQLDKLSDAANEENLELAVWAGLRTILNLAIIYVPKKTRTLSRSLHIETIEKRRDYVMAAMGTDVVYGPIQEFGGVVKNAFGKGDDFSVTIPAHPYMRPAWDERIDSAQGIIRRVLVKLLTRPVT